MSLEVLPAVEIFPGAASATVGVAGDGEVLGHFVQGATHQQFALCVAVQGEQQG